MSQTVQLVPERSFPVTLGALTFYAASWKLTGQRQYAEQGGVTGSICVVNSSMKARRLVLDGWLCFDENPAEAAIALDAAMADNQRFVFTFREMRFIAATLVEYTLEEAAKDGRIPCQLVLITTSSITAPPAESDTETEGTT